MVRCVLGLLWRPLTLEARGRDGACCHPGMRPAGSISVEPRNERWTDVTQWKRGLKCLHDCGVHERRTRSLNFLLTSLFYHLINQTFRPTWRALWLQCDTLACDNKSESNNYFLYKFQLLFLCLFFNAFTFLSFATKPNVKTQLNAHYTVSQFFVYL